MGAQIGGKMANMPIGTVCVISAADPLLRQQTRDLVKNSSRRQFLGLWSFF